MATESLDWRFPSFQEYINEHAHNRTKDVDSTPLYAHPMDEWILRALNSAPVKNVLDRAIDAYISTMIGDVLASGIMIDQKSFPELFAVLTHCAHTLGIPVPHAVAGNDQALFNAFTAGTEEYAFISITSGLMKQMTKEEVTFVVGHECGHIAANHMAYNTLVHILTTLSIRVLGPLGQILRQTAGYPLMAWSRRAEITADRAGLLCCGDIKVGERALLRLVAGFADVEKVDVDDYLQKYKEMQEFHSASKWWEVFYTHPMIPKRIEALRLFARSELYYELSGKAYLVDEDLLSRSELDRRVNQIVKP